MILYRAEKYFHDILRGIEVQDRYGREQCCQCICKKTGKEGLLYMPCDINSAFYISIAIPVADMLFEQALADTI